MKYKVEELTIHHAFQQGCPGQEVVFATHPQSNVPVAFIWYQRNMMDRVEIENCYTREAFRRMGCFRALIKQLIKWWPKRTIQTAAASRLAKPALKKLGFIQTPSGWMQTSEGRKICQK